MDEYDAAFKSIKGQYNLWDELDAVVATSAEDIKAALESQTEYWTNYAENLSNLNGRNIEGLNAFVAAVDEIEKFIPEEYWNIYATLLDKKTEMTFEARLAQKENKKLEIHSKEEVDKILEDLKGAKYSNILLE